MVAGGMAMRGVHSATSWSMCARPASRLALRSAVSCCGVRSVSGFGTHGPDGRDPGQAGALAPEFGEVEPEQRRVDGGFDLRAVFAGEQRGVADEQRGVVRWRAWRAGRLVARRSWVACRGSARRGCARRRRSCSEAESAATVRTCVRAFVGAKAARVLHQQQDAAHLAERGDGAAGDDGELRRERGDGDEAEVGGAGVQLRGAGGGQRVVHVVVRAKLRRRGVVLEVVEQRRGIEERDGGDAKRHKI